jgi:hypothetical protein
MYEAIGILLFIPFLLIAILIVWRLVFGSAQGVSQVSSSQVTSRFITFEPRDKTFEWLLMCGHCGYVGKVGHVPSFTVRRRLHPMAGPWSNLQTRREGFAICTNCRNKVSNGATLFEASRALGLVAGPTAGLQGWLSLDTERPPLVAPLSNWRDDGFSFRCRVRTDVASQLQRLMANRKWREYRVDLVGLDGVRTRHLVLAGGPFEVEGAGGDFRIIGFIVRRTVPDWVAQARSAPT